MTSGGISLVVLVTVHRVRYVTIAGACVAFCIPECCHNDEDSVHAASSTGVAISNVNVEFHRFSSESSIVL